MTGVRLAGRYRLVTPLGEGGMGVVYRGVDELLGRSVAVKLLREPFAADREFVERFRREAQLAASLSHPNVVQIFDVGRDDGRHFIVMELVDGLNLKEILRVWGRLEVAAAAAIALAVARALAHAHRHGLIHRDIKPHNILVTAEGLVKVADFGIARASSASSLTDAGTVIGSVHYFSPEQARGQSIGAASDLYSLGVVLYEMLTGQLPFHADSALGVVYRHLHESPAPPRALRPEIPEALEACILETLAKDPSRRPPSADALAEAIRRAVPRAEGYSLVPLVAGCLPASTSPVGANGDARGRAAAAKATSGGASEATRVVGLSHGQGAGEDAGMARRSGAVPAGRRRRRGLWWAFALAFFGGVAAAAGSLSDLLFPQEVLVPNIVGRSEEEARAILKQRGLVYAVDQRVFSSSVPQGLVVRQDPEAGRQVREGRKVWATLSLGPEVGEVPELVGRSLQEARVLITQQQFVLGTVTDGFAPEYPANTVIFQDPPPGTRLEKGRPINLVVSRGVQPLSTVVLPDFTGMEFNRVREELERLGLKLGATWPEYDAVHPPGTVIDQNPQPGVEVEQGSAVGVVYSQGPPPTPQATSQSGPLPREVEPARPELGPPSAASAAPPRGEPEAGSPEAPPGPVASGTTPSGSPGKWHAAEVAIQVPQGPAREVVILVIDDFGPSEAFRKVVPGGSLLRERVRGRGDAPRYQVYVDGRMVQEAVFPGVAGP